MKPKTSKSIALIFAIVMVVLSLLSGCGKKANTKVAEVKNDQQETTVSTTQSTDPYALTKEDFDYGGNTVKGYSNFIDLCEAQAGLHHYYFTVPSVACANANRGINIRDNANLYEDKVKEKFGTPDETRDLSFYDDSSNGIYISAGRSYVYGFKYNGRQYYKIFYIQAQHGGGEDYVQGIEYKMV